MNRGEKLYRAIGGVPEDLVNEAMSQTAGAPKAPWKRWGALAAALALVTGLGLYSLGRMGGASAGGGGHGESSEFMSYAGPVFPLTVLEGGEGLTAARELTWDYSPFVGRQGGGDRVYVTDVTILKNDTEEERTLTLAYPFVGSFRELALPAMEADGEEVATRLVFGGYSGGYTQDGQNLRYPSSWEGYRDLLADGGYQEDAFGEYRDLTQPVTVYEFLDSAAPEVEDGAPTVAVSFTIDPERTQVYSYGFNGVAWEETGERRFSYFVPDEDSAHRDTRRLLVALGDPIGEYALGGYVDGACEKELDGVSVRVERFETTLGEVLRLCVEDFCSVAYYDPDLMPPATTDMVYQAAADLLSHASPGGMDPKARYDAMFLDDIVSEAVNMDRVFWIAGETVLRPGEEKTVSVRLRKDLSFDFVCADTKNKGVFGFDLVTALGSTLDFDRVTAKIENTQGLKIVRQNCGFDLDQGITQVELDPGEPHYYLEVRRLPEKS